MLRTKQRNSSFFISSSITFLMTEICQCWLFITDEFHPSTPTQLYACPRVCACTHECACTHTHTHTQTHGYLFHFVDSLFFGFKHRSNRKTVKTESLTLKLNWTELNWYWNLRCYKQVNTDYFVPYIWLALYNFYLKHISFWWTFSMLHLLYPQKGHRSSCNVSTVLVKFQPKLECTG